MAGWPYKDLRRRQCDVQVAVDPQAPSEKEALQKLLLLLVTWWVEVIVVMVSLMAGWCGRFFGRLSFVDLTYVLQLCRTYVVDIPDIPALA